METYQEKIKQKLTVVPTEPGCYLMKDRNDQIIYVGKAKKLRNRLRSYFTGAHDAKTTRLVGEIRNFEFIVTSSETESLLLELNLIKQYQNIFYCISCVLFSILKVFKTLKNFYKNLITIKSENLRTLLFIIK